MKKIRYIFQIVLVSFVFGLTSCDDWFDLRPESETILEDYWNDENDVLSMVGSCYRGMNEIGFMERLMVWGEVRSDNVLQGANQDDNLKHFFNLTLNAANGYTSWGEFYKVINYCNSVIYYAPGVREKDPNFTEGQLRAYLAEVRAIRALCYFTLVRAFRDIPFIVEPVIDDTQPFEVPQSDPSEILDYLINDLKEIENSAITGYENVLTYDKGRITRKAIWAIIADMALWRNDYDTCIEYCDKVINQAERVSLESSTTYYYNLFLRSNSNESIFELQFNNNISNYSVYEMYTSWGMGTRPGQSNYKLSSYDFIQKTELFGQTDLRGKDFFIPIADNSGLFPIVKYVALRYENSTGVVSRNDYSGFWSGYGANWIFYRLADIYLMKAEALAEKGSNADLEKAFELVSITYDRANPDLGTGSLKFSDYDTQLGMRNLVFDERQRELMFEGKRYFDLLRRINREGNMNVVRAYLLKKYETLDQATVTSKISDIDALYMPINEGELRLNTELIQNPFYNVSSGINKN